ncbi:MAG TPA: tRNA pseudouridine(38-40) synthase TruA [Candidatus Omnitrophota bacterium]|nr:tRNA pseudouridine(38-40) synthase TruA [Candidatus Omnitrophota bacterium]
MRNIRLTIQYDGTDYLGWQKQAGTDRTIQTITEKALKQILQEPVRLTAAGRTDSGVHAAAQVANFKTNNPISLAKLQYGLNSLLPDDIKVVSAKNAAPDFHSRYHAREKTYQYTILNRPYPDVFIRKHVYHYGIAKLDLSRMRAAARLLVGRHDFTSFRATGATRSRSNVRMIKRIGIAQKGDLIIIQVTGEGFLYKMVRGIVGTLIEIGRGRFPVSSICRILDARKRTSAGPTAPASGLCLLRVRY